MMRSLIRQNRPFFVIYALWLLAGGLLLVTFDRTVLFQFVNQHHSPAADWLMRNLTHVGDGLFYLATAALLLRTQFRYAALALGCYAATGLSAQVFKRFVFADALRPVRFYEHTDVPVRLVEGVTMYGNNSFPSGHATTAFSMFCLLSLLITNKRWGTVFALLAFATSYSRVYLSQHFVGDIYAGSVLGVALTLLLARWWLAHTEAHPRPWHRKHW